MERLSKAEINTIVMPPWLPALPKFLIRGGHDALHLQLFELILVTYLSYSETSLIKLLNGQIKGVKINLARQS
jgi:hypothetical protein